MTPLAEDRAEPIWFIKTQGKVWGPYPGGRVEGFIAEGRVAATTLMSAAPEGPFSPAGLQGELRRLFAPAVAPEPAPETAAELSPHAQLDAEPVAVEHAGHVRPLLVFAALASLDESAFESVLAIQGPYDRIAAGLWLVKARLGAAALRNALSRRLRGDDTLVVVEAGLDKAAWFNLDLDEERRLRTLWAG